MNKSIETGVIGGILLDPEVLESCLAMGLTDKAFSTQGAQIFKESLSLFTQGKDVNSITLMDSCDRTYMAECMDAYIGPSVAESSARELLRTYRMASIKDKAKRFAIMADKWKKEPEELLGKAADIFTLEEGMTIDDPIKEAEDLINYWETTPENERGGLHWFLPEMENAFGPITNELVFLEAARSVGKTAFALCMCVYAAKHSSRTSFVSLESMKESMAVRLITVVTGENSLAMKRGSIYPSSYGNARQALKSFPKENIGWSFNTRSIESILAWAKSEKRKGSKALFIDNMRHIHGERGRSKTEEFGDMSKGLKRIRDNVGLPVIVLHHLNKEGDTGWSQDIENDADMIIKLTNQSLNGGQWSETIEDIGQEVMDVRMNVSKARDGRCGMLPMKFVKSQQRFLSNILDGDVPEGY